MALNGKKVEKIEYSSDKNLTDESKSIKKLLKFFDKLNHDYDFIFYRKR